MSTCSKIWYDVLDSKKIKIDLRDQKLLNQLFWDQLKQENNTEIPDSLILRVAFIEFSERCADEYYEGKLINDDFLDFMIVENSIYFKEIPVIKNSMTTVAREIENKLDKLDVLGYFIASIFIQSRLKNIICTSGNCEAFIMFFRENANGVIQYLKQNEFIHGSKNIFYDANETQFWF